MGRKQQGARGDSAVVREWRDEEGWGVIDSPATPGGCRAHFTHLDMEGYRSLQPGQSVELEWEQPGQDGYEFRAVRIRPRHIGERR